MATGKLWLGSLRKAEFYDGIKETLTGPFDMEDVILAAFDGPGGRRYRYEVPAGPSAKFTVLQAARDKLSLNT